MSLAVPTWAWAAFVVIVLACLAIDLFLHRGDRVDSRRKALLWTLAWIGVSMLFALGVGIFFGGEAASQFLAAYVLEKTLSIDNLFVFLLLFSALSIPRPEQRRVLTWGILGALVTRGLFIGLGAAALHRWHWVVYPFGALLAFTGARMLGPEREEKGESALLGWLRRRLRWSPRLHGHRFFVREGGRRVATPLFVALVAIEMSDVIFAVDSVPAAFAVSDEETFIVYTSNILALLGLRSLFTVVAEAIGGLRYLRYGLASVLILAGGKMIASRWVHLPTSLTLAAIGLCLGAAIAASLLHDRWPRWIGALRKRANRSSQG